MGKVDRFWSTRPGLVALLAMVLSAVFLLGTLGLRIVQYEHHSYLMYDDAFFFVRYAGNFLETGVFEWNRGDGPVHGNTSQSFQLIVTLLHWLLGRNIVLTLVVATTTGALTYLVVVLAAYRQMRPQLAPAIRWPTFACIAVFATFDGQMLIFVNIGMETTWALVAVALSLFASFRIQSGVVTTSAIAFNAVAVLLVYMTRPDATLIAMSAPIGLLLFAREKPVRRAGLVVCLVAIPLIAAFVLACWWYYGSPLPLASATKTPLFTNLPREDRLYLGDTVTLFKETIRYHKAETLLALGGLTIFFRLPPALRGAVIGAGGFILYHLTFVLPMIGEFGRFYGPILPVVLLTAAMFIEVILGNSQLLRISKDLAIGLMLALILLLAHRIVRVPLAVVPGQVSDLDVAGGRDRASRAINLAATNMTFFGSKMVLIVELAGTECSIAATEDGILSALARDNVIVDLSGLHDRRMARDGFSADRVLLEQRPDILAQPHPWYAQWVADLAAHPAMAHDYVRETPLSPLAPWIAFRRDSECAMRVRRTLYAK